MSKRRKRATPDAGLKAPVKSFDETFSAEDAVLDWLKQNKASESVTYDQDTGEPMRTFTIKL